MKNKRVLYLILVGILLLMTAKAALAAVEAHSLGWWTVDGGGGTSSGGAYTVSGTSGQADAGWMSGGSYSLAGGYWSGAGAPQPPSQPKLYLPLIRR